MTSRENPLESVDHLEERRDEREQPTLGSESNLHEIFDDQHENSLDLSQEDVTRVHDKIALWFHTKITKWGNKTWFTPVKVFSIMLVYSVFGALIFLAIEGEHERTQLIAIKEERDILLSELYLLATNQTGLADKRWWRTEVINHLNRYEEQLYASYYEANVVNGKVDKWKFWSALFYCGTVFTTIGYGQITPSTDMGRAVTIVYALFGIPLFLLLLADSGKFLTGILNWMWAHLHRSYVTCWRRMKFIWLQQKCCRRHMPEDCETSSQTSKQSQNCSKQTSGKSGVGEHPVIPTLDLVNFDELDLPLSVALIILIIYMFVGAYIYYLWEEEWSFFDSFYFVFISMSTIGFGDYFPEHPMYLMATILYLVFGLALMSMCVNVMQVKMAEISKKILYSITART